MIKTRRFAGVLAVLCLAAAGTAQAGGSIVRLEGSASVERGGALTPAAPGFSLRSGDAIEVGEGSKAQLHFEDDALFALAGGTKFRVDELMMPQQKEPGSAVFSLLRGSFRTVTGLIGKATRDTYRVNTALATIGVRGSAYSVLLCEAPCAARARVDAGLYVKAESGTIIVKNDGGEIRLRAGKTALAVSIDKAPALVVRSPLDDPAFATDLRLDLDFDSTVEPPRIEPDPPASPS